MMLDGGKIKEIQVKLLLSSRSEMHKVIEAARQSVPLMSLAAPSPVPTPVTAAPVQPAAPTPPAITPFSAALGSNSMSGFGIPGIGNPQEIPQPAVIEPPIPLFSPTRSQSPDEDKEKESDKSDKKRKDDRRRTRSRSRSRSRDRDRKERKRDRRDRSRSRDRRRRDRSRSRDRRDRKRDRKDRSRSRDRSPRRSRDRRNLDKKSPPQNSQDRTMDGMSDASRSPSHYTAMAKSIQAQLAALPNPTLPNGPLASVNVATRFNDPTMAEALSKLQELGKKRNPNAFQGEPQNGNKFVSARGGATVARGGGSFRKSRFDPIDQNKDCCVVIKNAQNHTSYGDVRRFFPYMIDKHGIKMINDNMGRRTGTIYVRFCDSQSKQLALQRKNNELKGAKVVVESLDDSVYDAAVDSFLPFRAENDTDEDHAKLEAEKNNTLQSFSILKLSELPNFVKEHEIIKVFSDFSLLSIILDDCRTTRTKTAYVQFVKPEDAKVAFERKESYTFGRRQVSLTPLTQEEFENIKPKAEKADGPQLDTMQNNQENNMSIPRDPRQRRPQLDNGSAAPVAPMIPVHQQPQGFFPNPSFPQNMGQPFPGAAPQYRVQYPAPGIGDPRTAAANWNNRPPFPNQPNVQFQTKPPTINNQRAVTVNMEEEPLDSVLMKGLPREATDRTIVNFLSDTGAVPARIHLMLDGSGMPSGDCFCEFRSTQEARQAVTKHGQMLDGCRITVDLVTRGVVEEALEGPKEGKNPPPGPSLLGSAPPFFEVPRFAGPGQPFRGRGGFDRGGFDRGGFRGGFDQGRGGFDKSRGGFDQGRGGFDMSRGGFRGRGGWMDRGRGFDRGRGRGFGRGRGGFTNGDPRPPMPMNEQEEQDPALEDFGTPGCVVSMENVPFRATVDDILTFFTEFELTQDDVIRRYNERGQPTGDARVAFRTPFDAQRAVKTRQMNTIFDRRINLTIL
ncbi:unnamed protein product [Colias eurytheme]|nr:unnamed protein product [Colias eurytheme]